MLQLPPNPEKESVDSKGPRTLNQIQVNLSYRFGGFGLDQVASSGLVGGAIGAISRHIRENDLMPGDRLPSEAILSKELNVSRTVVREAFRSLAAMRIIELATGKRATVAQIAEATGWNSNTVRGFLAGLKKKGHAVEVMERVRQVGPNQTGAKGSFTVYRIAS